MDGHPRQNPAYRPATEEPRESGALSIIRVGLAGCPPAQLRSGMVDASVCRLQRIVEGKVAQEHIHFDRLEILAQLGLVPEPARV